MQSSQEESVLEHSKLQRGNIGASVPILKDQNLLGSEESKCTHEKIQAATFFEKQQNEILNLYNSDSTILQMALASKTSMIGVKYQIMEDLITATKRPTMKEYLATNTALDFKQTPPFIISASSQAAMEFDDSEHESENLEDEDLEYDLVNDATNNQQEEDDEADWSDDG